MDAVTRHELLTEARQHAPSRSPIGQADEEEEQEEGETYLMREYGDNWMRDHCIMMSDEDFCPGLEAGWMVCTLCGKQLAGGWIVVSHIEGKWHKKNMAWRNSGYAAKPDPNLLQLAVVDASRPVSIVEEPRVSPSSIPLLVGERPPLQAGQKPPPVLLGERKPIKKAGIKSAHFMDATADVLGVKPPLPPPPYAAPPIGGLATVHGPTSDEPSFPQMVLSPPPPISAYAAPKIANLGRPAWCDPEAYTEGKTTRTTRPPLQSDMTAPPPPPVPFDIHNPWASMTSGVVDEVEPPPPCEPPPSMVATPPPSAPPPACVYCTLRAAGNIHRKLD